MADKGLLPKAQLRELIVEYLSEKFASASSPSVVKSYSMLVAYCLFNAENDQEMMGFFSQIDSAQKILDKWTTYQSVFEGKFAKALTFLGITRVLHVCIKVEPQLGQILVSKGDYGDKSKYPLIYNPFRSETNGQAGLPNHRQTV
jgi:hypothetical protein